ncbi:MAG: hypothetical protein ABI614_16855 [Planctomycetota bacterium]
MTLELAIKRLSVECGKPADIEAVHDAVLAQIRQKLGSPKCDLWRFLHGCGYTNRQIEDHLRHGLPKDEAKLPTLIEIYADLITTALLRQKQQRCGCALRYESYDSRKSVDMQRTCEKNHWIKSYEPSASRQPKAWLRYAIDGDSILGRIKRADSQVVGLSGMYRAFGNSMLCAVLTTPAETGLYLVKRIKDGEKVELLVDSRHIEQSDRPMHSTGDEDDESLPTVVESAIDKQPVVLAWYCESCRRIVGKEGVACCKAKCVWTPHQVAQAIDDETPTYRTSVGICAQRHCWPKRGQNCPQCDGEQVDRKMIWAVYVDVMP